MAAEIAFVGRALRYSPRNVDNDHAILETVRQELKKFGNCHEIVNEDKMEQLPDADIYISMGRSKHSQELLTVKEAAGCIVVNSPMSVQLCNSRKRQMQLLEAAGVEVPPLVGQEGYWVKRGTGCRETDADVQFVPDKQAAELCREAMQQRGIDEVDIRAHISGSWLKFYGVGNSFFQCYRAADGMSPVTGRVSELHGIAKNAAQIVGLDVYGGDFIVSDDSHRIYIVDLNDWPSFSACWEKAAKAIANLVVKRMENGQ